MTYEELRILLDVNDPVEVLRSAGRPCHGWWFVICDGGDCHLFGKNGKEHDISWVKRFTESIVPADVKRVIIPNGVESIDHCAFAYCKSLKSIDVPKGAESIGDHAFASCTSLKSIELPSSVKRIGQCAFYSCTSLEKLAFKGKTIEQVRAMDNYPWDIEDESAIKCA